MKEKTAIIINIWETIFNKNNIKEDDNFFYLGGNSIKFAELYVLLKDRFNFSIELDDFVNYLTPKEQAQQIENMLLNESTAEVSICQPMLPIQELIYQRYLLSDTLGVLPSVIIIKSQLNKKYFLKNLIYLIQNISSLNKTFHQKGGFYFTKNKSVSEKSVPVVFQSIKEGRDYKRESLRAMLVKPFNLSEDFPFRLIVQYKKDEFLMGFACHHIIVDFISYAKIIKLISLINKKEFSLNPKISNTKNNNKNFDFTNEALDYWTNNNFFKHCISLKTPTHLIKYEPKYAIISELELNTIKQFCKINHLTTNQFLLALVAIFIEFALKDKAPIIGTPYLTRDVNYKNLKNYSDIHPDYDYMVFLFKELNMPLIEKFSERSKEIKFFFENKMPYSSLIKLHENRILTENKPLFNYLVLFHDYNPLLSYKNLQLDNYDYYTSNPPIDLTPYHFIFSFGQKNKGLNIKIRYSLEMKENGEKISINFNKYIMETLTSLISSDF